MSRVRAGDWVEVRSKDEILRTLDKEGRLDNMPFMPQMFQYCGKRFKVYKRAHKTCDTIAFNWDSPGRSLRDGVHLNLRCDGQVYGGCQAACLLFWKEQWLKPANSATESAPFVADQDASTPLGESCTEEDILKATRAPDLKSDEEIIYRCQATQLLEYTRPLPWWDCRQYIEDYTSGNVTFWQIIRGTIYVCYYYPTLSFTRRYGGPARWFYDWFQRLWGGIPFPRRRGELPDDEPAPIGNLNLQPGELVRIKPFAEIRKTIHWDNKNRGMAFDAELVPYCGGTYRVRARVEKFINEKTGKIMTMKTPGVILEDVFCRARYSECRMHCPRSIYSWWREVWLERVSGGTSELASESRMGRVSTPIPKLSAARNEHISDDNRR
jgi:hypothetical protein